MAKVIAIPPVPGVSDVFTLLQFMANAPAYAERLKELESVREEINGLILKVGLADEIETLRERSGQTYEDAKNELAQARKQAQELLDGAQATLDDERAKIDAQRRDLADLQEQDQLARVAAAADLAERLAEIFSRETEAARKAAEAATQSAAASALMKEAQDKLTRLRNAGVV